MGPPHVNTAGSADADEAAAEVSQERAQSA